MKRSILFAAAIVVAAAPAFATVNIQKEAKAKNAAVTCKTCHTAMPCTKANLTDEGKKWIPAPAKK